MDKINKIFYEDDIFSMLKKENSSLSNASLKWELFKFIKENSLIKVGKKKYVSNGKSYSYEYESTLTKEIEKYLLKNYTNLKIVIWESRQLNEWLNLLLASNIIYVEVEKEYINYVFSSLNDVFGGKHLILLNPKQEDVSKYLRDDLIVVKTLYSKSPISKETRKIKLEKLIVDLYCDHFFLDSSSKMDVICGIKDSYNIDVDNMLAYASRRRVKQELFELWEADND